MKISIDHHTPGDNYPLRDSSIGLFHLCVGDSLELLVVSLLLLLKLRIINRVGMRSHKRETVIVGGCKVLHLSEGQQEEATEDGEESCKVHENHQREGIDQSPNKSLHF